MSVTLSATFCLRWFLNLGPISSWTRFRCLLSTLHRFAFKTEGNQVERFFPLCVYQVNMFLFNNCFAEESTLIKKYKEREIHKKIQTVSYNQLNHSKLRDDELQKNYTNEIAEENMWRQ